MRKFTLAILIAIALMGTAPSAFATGQLGVAVGLSKTGTTSPPPPTQPSVIRAFFGALLIGI